MSAKVSGNTERILKKISEIVEGSADGSYVFRGEPKHYEEVSSTLYRQYRNEIEVGHYDIGTVQTEILEEAKKYTDKTNDFDILAELQHYGGRTNLIDFTTDFLIALFFACESRPEKDGRVILQRESENFVLREAHHPRNRILSQKSRFHEPPKGFIKPDKVVSVPKELKQPMLDHLRKCHGITSEAIYNDLHGFIRNKRTHDRAYSEYYRARTFHEEGDYNKAIHHYGKAIDLYPSHALTYQNRGTAYFKKGDFARAIQDHTKAIDLNPNYALAYSGRGVAYANIGDFVRAIQDYTKAIDLDPNYAEAYNNRGLAHANIGDFARAIQDFTKAIDLNPNHAEAYNNRGTAYLTTGDFVRAIQDFTKAIDLNPNYALAYNNRGHAWFRLEEWDKVRSFLRDAKGRGWDFIGAFRHEYQSVEEFERQYGVCVPEDIRTIMTARQRA